MTRFGLWVRGLVGWRRALLAFAAGAVSATGFAPLEFFPALLLGFAILVLLLDCQGLLLNINQLPLNVRDFSTHSHC